MTSSPAPLRPSAALTNTQIEDTIAALQRAAAAFSPSKGDEWLFSALTLWVRAAAVSLILVAIGTLVLDALPELSPVATPGLVAYVVGLIGLSLVGLTAPVLLLSNLPLARRIVERHLALRRLGLHGAVRGIRQANPRPWIVRSIWLVIVVVAAAGFLAVAALAWYRSAGGTPMTGWFVVVALGLVLIGCMLLVTVFLEQKKSELEMLLRADEIRALLQSLQVTQPSPKVLAVPAAMLEQAARIERAQIVKERNAAIVASGRTTWVIASGPVAEAKRQLSVEQRIAEERLLMALAKASGSETVQDLDPTVRHARTPDGSVAVQYSVSGPPAQIVVHGLVVTALAESAQGEDDAG